VRQDAFLVALPPRRIDVFPAVDPTLTQNRVRRDRAVAAIALATVVVASSAGGTQDHSVAVVADTEFCPEQPTDVGGGLVRRDRVVDVA